MSRVWTRYFYPIQYVFFSIIEYILFQEESKIRLYGYQIHFSNPITSIFKLDSFLLQAHHLIANNFAIYYIANKEQCSHARNSLASNSIPSSTNRAARDDRRVKFIDRAHPRKIRENDRTEIHQVGCRGRRTEISRMLKVRFTLRWQNEGQKKREGRIGGPVAVKLLWHNWGRFERHTGDTALARGGEAGGDGTKKRKRQTVGKEREGGGRKEKRDCSRTQTVCPIDWNCCRKPFIRLGQFDRLIQGFKAFPGARPIALFRFTFFSSPVPLVFLFSFHPSRLFYSARSTSQIPARRDAHGVLMLSGRHVSAIFCAADGSWQRSVYERLEHPRASRFTISRGVFLEREIPSSLLALLSSSGARISSFNRVNAITFNYTRKTNTRVG